MESTCCLAVRLAKHGCYMKLWVKIRFSPTLICPGWDIRGSEGGGTSLGLLREISVPNTGRRDGERAGSEEVISFQKDQEFYISVLF